MQFIQYFCTHIYGSLQEQAIHILWVLLDVCFKYMKVVYQNYVSIRAHAVRSQVFPSYLVSYSNSGWNLVNRA